MSKNDWLADERHMLAADRILDAASTLFAASGNVDSVGLQEIATAAGCSRTTLYRYFPTREDLHVAYAHRETRRVIAEVAEHVKAIPSPPARLVEGILYSLATVRRTPALAAWFARRAPIGSEIADESDVVTSLMAGYLRTVRPASATDDVTDRARWLIRSITSLLQFPEADCAAERHIAEHFIVPAVLLDLDIETQNELSAPKLPKTN